MMEQPIKGWLIKCFMVKLKKNMEVYVDDMLVKSKKMEDHITYLDEAFRILKQYNIK